MLTVEAPGKFSTAPLVSPGKCCDPQWDNYCTRGTASGFLIKCHTCAPRSVPEIQIPLQRRAVGCLFCSLPVAPRSTPSGMHLCIQGVLRRRICRGKKERVEENSTL